ncbi:MAG: hypothetical protein KKB60_12080 [Gammaproteobacteria bacterium]|nr:hypothetical protein [Gammaproteobacteria bacterium]
MTSDITTNDLQHMQAELAGAEKPLDVMAAVGGVMDKLVGVVKAVL